MSETFAKHYNNISISREHFTKKLLLYANPSPDAKTIHAELTPSPYCRLKHKTISIPAYSNGGFQLRLYFDRTAQPKQHLVMRVIDGDIVEELHFNICLNQD